jgi:hypothetical protein
MSNQPKKYLSLDEAAAMLGMRKEELTRLRERGDIRGFADRGTWKFKVEDVENLGRSRQADSDPDAPAILDENLDVDDLFTKTLSPDDSTGSGVLFDPEAKLGLGGESDMVLPGGGAEESDLIIPGDDLLDLREPQFAAGDSNVNDSSELIDPLANSDSDVRLILDDASGVASSGGGSLADSDSDVKLLGDADSDSDVKLVGDETVSDLALSPALSDSDSDVKLVSDKASGGSPAKLVDTVGDISHDELATAGPDSGDASDSDVALLGSDSDVALDFGAGDADESASVLAEESGLGLTDGSAFTLGTESGISLEGPSDSGIALGADADEGITLAPMGSDSGISLSGADSGVALDAGDSGISLGGADSGISLTASDSGISLEAVADSGISLEDSQEFTGTMPMMDAVRDLDTGPETKFEMPSLRGDDSAFELQGGSSGDETGVLSMQDSGEATLDDAVFDVDDADAGAAADEAFEVADEAADDEEVEDMGVFDADEDAFGGDEEEDAMGAALPTRAAPAEEWGTGVLVGLSFSCLTLGLCGVLMIDLVRSMWLWGDRAPLTGSLLNTIAGLYGG